MNIFDLQKTFVKTIIKDTIETYSGQWRLIHEALQNAHDHIQLNDKIEKGSIEIHLSVGSNVVNIKENGTGIAIEKFNNIFLIGGSDKTGDDFRKILKGSQGVGIKSTLFTSTSFRVETVHKDYTWKYELNDCHTFQEPTFNTEVEPPKTKPSSAPSGSTFTYSVHDYSVQKFINEIIQEYCEETKVESDKQSVESIEELKTVMETYFRTRTYLGCTQAMLGINQKLKPIEVTLVLHFDSHDPKSYKDIDSEYCQFFSKENLHGKRISHAFPAKYLDIHEICANLSKHDKPDKVYSDFNEILKSPPDQTTKKVLIQKFKKDEVKSLLSRTKRNYQTGDLEFEPDDDRLHKHKAVLDKINGMYLVVGQKPYLAKYFHIGTKQNISVNGLPTDISLNTTTGAVTYLNNVHIVLDVDYTLGFGKRNLPNRAKGMLDAFFLDAWHMLRRVVPLVVGQRAGIDPADIAVWDKAKEFESYQANGNKFRQASLFLKTTPKEEQEVIALFFELIGKKILKGYFPFRVSGKAVYDALFYIDQNERDTIPQKIKASDLKTVEFKYQISGLIDDMENDLKFLDDIDLLICWENDFKDDETEYSINSLSRDGIDPYPGAQLRLKRLVKTCQVLVLKDYLESLKLI